MPDEDGPKLGPEYSLAEDVVARAAALAAAARRPVRVQLPDEVMQAIQVLADSTALSPGERLFVINVLALGSAWYEAQQTIDPTEWVIPGPQWHAIAKALMNLSTNDGTKVDLALAWMNQGLSGDEKWAGE